MSGSIDRRRFLELTASTGLALAAGAGRAAEGAVSDKLVVAVIGTGGRGTTHATTLEKQAGVEVAYVCDLDQGRVGQAADLVSKVKGRNNVKAVRDFRRILDDKAVDAVTIAT